MDAPAQGPAPLRAPTVVVVGSVNEDLTLVLPRLPAPGETVTGGRASRGGGGKGANQAVAAARLGVATHLVALVGDDDAGRTALADLAAAGVGVGAVATAGAPTGLAAVLVDAAGESSVAVAPGANGELGAAAVARALGGLALPDGADVVLLACLEVSVAAVAHAAQLARSRGWRVVLDPAPAQVLPPELLALVDVLTPNEHEVTGLGAAGAPDLLTLLTPGAGAVVVTRGGAGADVHRPGAPPTHHEPLPVAALDTTGAGDAFAGALAAATACGAPLDAAVAVAVVAGSLACRATGARGSLADRAELTAVAPVQVGAVPGWAQAGAVPGWAQPGGV